MHWLRRIVGTFRQNARQQELDHELQCSMPLHLAVIKNQPAALKALLDLGANTESLDEAGFSALDLAALDGRHELAQILLERGAKVSPAG